MWSTPGLYLGCLLLSASVWLSTTGVGIAATCEPQAATVVSVQGEVYPIVKTKISLT